MNRERIKTDLTVLILLAAFIGGLGLELIGIVYDQLYVTLTGLILVLVGYTGKWWLDEDDGPTTPQTTLNEFGGDA
jgi:hypothetical protein